MPFLALPFPMFDPIAIAIGPFAVRWYALAYIAGIVLGWLYARKILRTEKFWGGPAPISIPQFDDYVLWVTLGIILGGRTGYVLFYNLGYFIAASAGDVSALAGRHVVPRRLPRLRRGRAAVRLAQQGAGALARRRHLRGRRRSGCCSAGSPTSSTANCGAGRPTCRGPSCSRPAGRCRGIRASSTRAALEGLLLFVVLTLMIRRGALQRPGLIIGTFAIVYGLARIFSEFFREPDPQLGFLWGGLTMGMLLSLPMIAAGRGFRAMGCASAPNQRGRPLREAKP